MNEPLVNLVKLAKSKHTKETIKYLKSRTLDKEIAIDWEIGYIPDFKTIQTLSDYQSLSNLGIVIKNTFSPLEKYITFPLYDQNNILIGLSGRTLDPLQKQRKYWHSVLEKRKFLFGLNKAKDEIRKKNFAIVCEGQFDVIMAHKNNIKNIVATMGTALTDEQVTLLSRYTNQIFVIFDNDAAGQKSLDKLKANNYYELNLYPVTIPTEGDDVDSYLRKYGKEAFEKLFKEKDDVSSEWDIL